MGKKAGEMTQQIKTFFHTHQEVFMWKESGKRCPQQSITFQIVLICISGFKLYLKGLIFKWYHKI
jgi:hypothetical protein